MLITISPAKNLDFESPSKTDEYSLPQFLADSSELVGGLKSLSSQDLSKLMGISEKLGDLNYQRFQCWEIPFTPQNAKQAIFSFQGEVYQGLNAESLCDSSLQTAQKNLRILSGLYGCLKPLDLIQPYRLEMGTKYQNKRGTNLYQFWGSRITDFLNSEMKAQGTSILVNLASEEYFKSVKKKELQGEIIAPIFKDCKNGKYKVISFYAKKARGLMSRFIVKNKLTKPEEIQEFNLEGYYFSPEESTESSPIFLREER